MRRLPFGCLCRKVGENIFVILNLFLCMKNKVIFSATRAQVSLFISQNLSKLATIYQTDTLTTVSFVRSVRAIWLIVTDKVACNTLLVLAQKISGF